MNAESPKEWLKRVSRGHTENVNIPVAGYVKNRSLNFNRPGVLIEIAEKSRFAGFASFFIEHNPLGLKRHFYVAAKLFQQSQIEGWDAFATYQPFLYGLLSDSPEVYDWLSHAELKNKDYVKGPHFLFHQFQLALRKDDAALRETIALVAKKGSNRDKALAAAGKDFFSLLLKQDKAGLQTLIEDQAKIKSAQELEGLFLAGYAVIHAKLCWIRGVEVEIKDPLVPMPLLPITPLDFYDVEYEFLRPGWTPPKPSMLDRVKRWIK